MERDFVEMLSARSAAGADYLVVGAHALAAHGVPRATGDLDVWVRATPDDARRVLEALRSFGEPPFDLSIEDLARPEVVIQIGVVPVRIDLLTSISGVAFEQAWAGRTHASVDGAGFGVLGREELLRNKRTTGRPKDLLDASTLEGPDRSP
jgi:hypothetical protein